jgi:hypothetical protein
LYEGTSKRGAEEFFKTFWLQSLLLYLPNMPQCHFIKYQ